MNPSHNLSLISFLLFWYEARQDIEVTRSIQLGTPGRKLAYGNKCLLQVNQQGSSYCFYSWMEDDSKTSKIEYNMIVMSIKMAEKGGTQSASLLWGLSLKHSALLWKLY